MTTILLLFWLAFAGLIYTYLLYPLAIHLYCKFFVKDNAKDENHPLKRYPSITLIVPAYNELGVLPDKISNTKALNYPKNKLNIWVVTDGSNDGSEDYLRSVDGIGVFHQPERAGKMAAMNRVMKEVKSDIVIFTDANAMLNSDAVMEIAKTFEDKKVGCVAGEKRVYSVEKAGDGEGIYWRYESGIKAKTDKLVSTIGAAGELFAIRTHLFQEPAADTILDDFVISLQVLREGYKIGYCPDAYALEQGSQNLKEELKRKIRICAGGIQAIVRTRDLLNPFKYPIFSFHYFSHRVLRWTVTPIFLLIVLITNIFLAIQLGPLYQGLLLGQLLFYGLAFLGWKQRRPHKLLLIPCYFTMMHLAVFLGWKRYFMKQQSVLWETSKRANA